MKPIRVLSVASEVYPLIKTGGLADVVGALPIALQGEAVETRTLVPGYPDVMSRLGAPARGARMAGFLRWSHVSPERFVRRTRHACA
jgi:glycogen synthase